MAFLRVDSTSGRRVGGKVLVTGDAPDLSEVTAQILFSRHFGGSPEYAFDADIHGITRDLINNYSQCYATVRVGPPVERVFTGRWYMRVKLSNLPNGEVVSAAADAIDFYGSGSSAVTGPGGGGAGIVDNGDGTYTAEFTDNGDGTVSG